MASGGFVAPGSLIMRDPDVIGWLKRQAGQASTVTSLCSGSPILGAAGLLAGYRAAAHWA